MTEDFASEDFTKAYWEERYHEHATTHQEPPNPQLVSEASDLVPGTVLDAGCGHGADSIWLASRGWQVTAVDIASAALHPAREYAESQRSDIADRIDWVEADLDTWAPTEERFDLVSTHYVHPAGSRDALFGRLAAAVAPGGTLLVVGHDPSDPKHANSADAYFTADDVAATLDPGKWDIAVAETRTRTTTHHGNERTLRDAVLRARKRMRF